jgi:hypothetical protein
MEFRLHYGVEDYGFLLLLVVRAHATLPVEEVDVAKVTRVVARVELPGPEGGIVV